jgi:exopolysaccharide production protein ExoZ
LKPLLSIQYLRACAALAVVAFHTGRATILGQAGVDIFFIISGFLIWTTTEKPVGSVRFVVHRLIRIVPLYWIATLAMAAVENASMADIARSLLFIPFNGDDGPILTQGWTLNVEMFFYAVFAGLLLLPRRFQLGFLTLLFCSLSLIGVTLKPSDVAVQTYTSTFLIEFLAGAWLAQAYQRGKLAGTAGGIAMVVAGTLLFFVSLLDPTPEKWRFIVWGFPSLLVVGGAISIEATRTIPKIWFLNLVGGASYSIYLFHPFVQPYIQTPLNRLPFFVPVSAFVLAGGAIGIVSFYLLERPLTKWLRRRASGVLSEPELHVV